VEGLRRTTKKVMISDPLADIRTEELLNTNQEWQPLHRNSRATKTSSTSDARFWVLNLCTRCYAIYRRGG